MKAKRMRTFLHFLFLIFYLRYILVGIQPINVEGLGTIWLNIVGACENQNKLSKAVICIKKDLIEIGQFPQGYFDHFLLAFIPKIYDFRG